ncbi:putative transposase, partial [Phenoliferia sp. Uapishka_3]
SHPAYPPFDVDNAFMHARLDHPATILETRPSPPTTPRNSNWELWQDEIHDEVTRLGLMNTGRDFLFPVGLEEGDAVRVIWDSGANRHYWLLKQYLHNFVAFDSPRHIGGAFGSVGVAVGSGTLKAIFTLDDGSKHAVAIHDVYLVPSLGANLVSAGQLFQQGVGCIASPARVTLTHANRAPFGYVDINTNGTMLLNASFVRSNPSPSPSPRIPILSSYQALITYPADRNLWHRRLGHCGGARLDQVAGMVDGLSFCNSTPLSPCIKCSQGKITRKPVRKVALRHASSNLERIAVDVWGPSRVVGLGGARYIFAIIDQHSRYMVGFAQQLKSQALPNLQAWTRKSERLQGRKLVEIRSDHGGETKSNAMTDWCEKGGYAHELANVRSHDENGIIERQFRTILNMVRTALLESGLPLFLWVECFLASIYVKNRLPTRGLIGANAKKTPYEVWFGSKPDLSKIQVWGCEVVVHYSLELKRDKATDRGWRGFMVGYSEVSNAWRIYDPAKRMVLESPNVDFFEDVFRNTPPSEERLSQLHLFDHDLPFSNAPLLEIPIPRPFKLSWEARVDPSSPAATATTIPLSIPITPSPAPASRIPRPSATTPVTPLTPATPSTPRPAALFDTPSPGAPTPAPLGPRVRTRPVKWQPSGKKLSLQARLVVESENPYSSLGIEENSSIGHLGGDSEQVPSPPTVSPYVHIPSSNVNTTSPSSSRNLAHFSEGTSIDSPLPPSASLSRRERLAARVASTRLDYDAALRVPFSKFNVKKLQKAHTALRTATRVEHAFVSSCSSASPAILDSIAATLNADGQPVWSEFSTNSLRLPGGGLGHNSSPPTVRPQIVSPTLEPQDDALLASSEIDLEALLHELLPSLPDPSLPILSCAQLSLDDALDYTVYAVQADFSGDACPITDLHSYNAWSGSVDEPTFSQAMRGPDRDQWLAAVHKELAMLRAMGTWDPSPVSLPAQRRALLSKWVLLIKRDNEGRVIKYKARLVARGDMQTEGLDYTETFAATVRQSSVRAILALAAQNGWKLQQFDVSSAYLHGTLKEEVYLRQPPGFGDESDPSGVLRLRKSLYGLCQAGHEWNNLLHSTLLSFGMERTGSDHGVYHITKDGETLILAIHVDDGLVASSSDALSKALEVFLQSKFDVDCFGAASIFLGLRITQDLSAGVVTVDQRGVTAGYVAEFLGLTVSPVSTPCDPKLHLVAATPAEAAALDPTTPYRAAIGALLWLSLSTRPDIAFAVSVVGRHSASPGVAHWTAVKRIFRYLAGTPHYGLVYRKMDGELVGVFDAFSDADHAGDHDSRKSTSGFVVRLAGAAISWLARLQKSVSILTTEAEYMGLSACAMEVVWLRALFSELGFRQLEPTLIRGDNMGSISLAKHPTAHQRTKHIAIHYHFTRDKVATKEVVLKWIPTADMVADVMTKGLDAGKHKGFSADCGLSDVLREGEC